MKQLLIFLINFYRRFISPLFPPSCRFVPTCSQYALEAIKLHGTIKGSCLSLGRVCRCHPFHKGGYDPVPSLSDNFTSLLDRAATFHDQDKK